ncbi:YdcF family protein [Dyadobacter sp. LJ53]|uniref:YdcF family protein n=1 Tax=Dyadobacter chenwenxiniae TaxID=2906456 RepID=UPI001F39AFA6|nr:YdcF family protein [Dyadobacter chenwenxiniae]MCF0052356.1 YdcF family protein [Dyadobacter chenwenxiniae]
MRILSLIFSVLVTLSLSGCGKMLYRSAEKAFNKGIKESPYDAVIVPGFPHNGKNWDMVLQMRIHWAHYLYTKGYTKNIIFSGSAVATPFVESKVMASYAHALGVPLENIFTEEKAEHSTENVYYSYRLGKDLGFTKLALATDPIQTSYMRRFIKRFELPIGLLPTVIDTLKVMNLYEPKVDLKTATREGFVKLSDRENFFERFRGTMGKYIIWHEEDLKKKKHRRKFKDRIIPAPAAKNEP